MKIILLLLSFLSLQAAPSGVYIEIGAGMALEKEIGSKKALYHLSSNTPLNLALGYQADTWRFELEGIYTKSEIESYETTSISYPATGSIQRDSQMFNIYYSGYNKSKLVSTIGAGVGITNIHYTELEENGIAQEDKSATSILSYQGMFSIGYMFNEDVTLTTKYKYFRTQKYKLEDIDQKVISENIFSLSLRYLF